MKKTRRPRWMMIQMLICSVLILGTFVLLALMSDRRKSADMTPPVISFPSATVQYTLEDETSDLLKDVRAEDETDGDVTASVRIRSISVSEDGTKAVVSYVAKDQANNIALEKRIVDVKAAEPTEPNSESETAPDNEQENKNETDGQS